MKLSEWLKKNEMKQQELAEKIGAYQPDISDLAHGRRTPTLATIQKIHDATRGEVSFADFAPEPKPKRAARNEVKASKKKRAAKK